MPSKFVVAGSTLGLASLIGAAQPAFGQWRAGLVEEPIIEERSYLTDYNTIYECLRRAAHDTGLSSRCSVGGSAWGDLTFEMQAKELFAVVADERKFPFLREDGRGVSAVSDVASMATRSIPAALPSYARSRLTWIPASYQARMAWT